MEDKDARVKLNLGCGFSKVDGWVNVDKFDTFSPDLILDLEQTPWPFEDNSVDEIMLKHVLEHLGAEVKVFLAIMQEIYRVCRPGAKVRIEVPHPRHDDFIADPTHVRIVTPDVLGLFSKRNNQMWREIGAANSQLAAYLDVDFELRATEMILADRFQEAYDRGEYTFAQMIDLARSQNNVFSEYRMDVEVIKG